MVKETPRYTWVLVRAYSLKKVVQKKGAWSSMKRVKKKAPASSDTQHCNNKKGDSASTEVQNSTTHLQHTQCRLPLKPIAIVRSTSSKLQAKGKCISKKWAKLGGMGDEGP